MRIATWNVNSVRARLPIIEQFIERQHPDVLAMQETKVADDDFPREPFENLGYLVVHGGQQSYNGVAIASRAPMELLTVGFDDGGPADPARLIAVRISGLPVVNTYVPQGRDPASEAFRDKLDWLQRLRSFFARHWSPDERLLWVGDMNVAPTPLDVWEPERHEGHADFHPDARAAFAHTASWGFVDVFRRHHPDAREYTFYDYRGPSAMDEGHGWRIDHIMATESLAEVSLRAWIDLEPRRAERPSDHAPLLAEFNLE